MLVLGVLGLGVQELGVLGLGVLGMMKGMRVLGMVLEVVMSRVCIIVLLLVGVGVGIVLILRGGRVTTMALLFVLALAVVVDGNHLGALCVELVAV